MLYRKNLLQIYIIKQPHIKQNEKYFDESIKFNLNFLKLISHLTFCAV